MFPNETYSEWQELSKNAMKMFIFEYAHAFELAVRTYVLESSSNCSTRCQRVRHVMTWLHVEVDDVTTWYVLHRGTCNIIFVMTLVIDQSGFGSLGKPTWMAEIYNGLLWLIYLADRQAGPSGVYLGKYTNVYLYLIL